MPVLAVAHHKDATRCGASVAVWWQCARGLEVVGLLAVEEGVVVQGVHQDRVHVTEKHANLRCRKTKTDMT